MYPRILLPALASILLIGCAEPNMDQGTAATSAEASSLGTPSTVTIRGHEGTYVACEIALNGDDQAILVASRATPGDWEKFTMYEKPDGKVSFQAANGKWVCSDEYKGGILVADRDQAGDWETFTMIPKDGGKVALQAHNGSFITADFGLTEARRGALFGNRTEVQDWELFTIERDTAAVQ